MQVHIIPILKDNYAYVVQSATKVAVIDPGEAAPIIDFLNEQGLHPDWIINTHKHADHVGGNQELINAFGCELAAPIECEGKIDVVLKDGNVFTMGNLDFSIMLTKGHTAEHIILFEPNHKILFSGDTLFAMGCGRLFEGDAGDMFMAMKKIKGLPEDTKIYCGHEYTRSNAEFAYSIKPGNRDIARRREQIQDEICTIPTILAQELKTNLFLIAETVSEFAEYRKAKDEF